MTEQRYNDNYADVNTSDFGPASLATNVRCIHTPHLFTVGHLGEVGLTEWPTFRPVVPREAK